METISAASVLSYKYPRWIVIQLLEKCNLRCAMCYEWGREGSYNHKKELAQLDPEIVKKVIADCSPVRPYFGLFGGEPLMYPWIEEILAQIHHYDLGIDIPTNGTLLETHAEMLVRTKPQRLWISLDGPPEINDRQRGQGVYQKVLQGIEKLDETRRRMGSELPKIGITFVVTPLNYLFIEKLFLECLDLSLLDHISIELQLYATYGQYQDYATVLQNEFGVAEAACAKGIVGDPGQFQTIDLPELIRQISHVRDISQERGIYFLTYPKTIEESNLRNFYTANWNQMRDKKSRCTFPWAYMEITAGGDVSPCHTFYDLTFGNIHQQGVLDIWNNSSYQKFRQYMRKNLLPICPACSRYYRDPSRK